MKRTRILALVLSCVMVLALFAGCKKVDQPTDPSKPVSPVTPVDDKIRTDIVIGEGADIISLDPIEVTDNYSAKALFMINDNLMKLDENTNIVPWLAESYEEVSPTEYIFKLRKGVMFHNGEELKASDVKFTLDRVKNSPKQAYMLEKVKEISAVDDYTVKIVLSEVYAPILLNLTESQLVILNEKAVTEAGTKYAQNPVGTGPMKFDSWKANDNLRMVSNEAYWAYKPATTSITIRVIPEASSRTIALETGEVDFISPVPAIDVPRVTKNTKLGAKEIVSSKVSYVGLNVTKKPLDDVRVRQALSYLTDKQTIIDVVYEGLGIPAQSPLPTIGSMYDPTVADMYKFDVEKAKALLTEAGFTDGFKLSVSVSSDETNRMSQVLQSDWAKAGITLDISVMEFGALLDYLTTGAHDMFILAWSQGNTNPDKTLTNNFHSSMIGASGNRSYFKNADVDTWLEDARKTTNVAEQKAIYGKVQHHVMEQAVWIPLFQPILYTAYNAGAEGIVWYKHGTFDYTNMVIKG